MSSALNCAEDTERYFSGFKRELEERLVYCSDIYTRTQAAEKYLQLRAARLCLQKAALPQEKVQLALAGDLQAQCTASSYAMRELGVPFAGLFGACSTMAEALGVGACLCSAGMADGLLAMTSSHFCTAERQYRMPVPYGSQRTPTAQWTATAAGCTLAPIPQGQEVVIVIGEALDKAAIEAKLKGYEN